MPIILLFTYKDPLKTKAHFLDWSFIGVGAIGATVATLNQLLVTSHLIWEKLAISNH